MDSTGHFRMREIPFHLFKKERVPSDAFQLYSSPSITEPPPPPPQPPPVPSPAQLPELVAKISRQDSSVFLEISVQAVRLGLLNLCLTATLLLQSGRNID